MSTFAVSRQTIGSILPIEGADRIELARLAGMDFSFVIGRGTFKIGDLCIYFPLDSILPLELVKKLGLEGKLVGKEKNRIKTVRLRGAISQGIVVSNELAASVPNDKLTEYFGVVKYEPPEIFAQDAVLTPLPPELSMYDIEGADHFVDVANMLMGVPVAITEKLEGSNFCVMCRWPTKEVVVCQRRFTVNPKNDNIPTFIKVANEGYSQFATELAEKNQATVALYGEMLGPGIQGNIYKLQKHEIRIFDIKVNGQWMPTDDFIETNVNKVPLLAQNITLREWLNGQPLKEASNGKSVLLPSQDREGVVIKPMQEQSLDGFGRLILKQRSPIYLSKHET